MRITVDLTKASTEIVDLSSKLNPRVGDGGLTLPFHVLYDDNVVDMHDKDIEFISQDPDGHDIYVSGTVDTSTPGDNAYQGDVTFKFPNGTFKKAGTYDTNKTMFRIVNKSDNSVISTVNVKLTVLDDGSTEFNFDPTKTGYNSRMEDMLNDFKEEHDKKIAIINQEGQQAADDAKAKAEATLDDVKDKAKQSLADITSQAQQSLDEIKQLSNEAKGNVAGDTAATAKQAKEQANDNAGKVHDLQGEVGDARGRFMTLSDRENKQDFNIERKEDKLNANANYAALQQHNAQQDAELADKADKLELEQKLSQMHLQPEGFVNLDDLKAKYPNGNSNVNVTLDNNHLVIWFNGAWRDCGQYQEAALSAEDKQRIGDLVGATFKNYLIKNGNFSDGNVAPAFATGSPAVKLQVVNFENRNWLRIDSSNDVSYGGVAWRISTNGVYYPLHFEADIGTIDATKLDFYIVGADSTGFSQLIYSIDNDQGAISHVAFNFNLPPALTGTDSIELRIQVPGAKTLNGINITGVKLYSLYTHNKAYHSNFLAHTIEDANMNGFTIAGNGGSPKKEIINVKGQNWLAISTGVGTWNGLEVAGVPNPNVALSTSRSLHFETDVWNTDGGSLSLTTTLVGTQDDGTQFAQDIKTIMLNPDEVTNLAADFQIAPELIKATDLRLRIQVAGNVALQELKFTNFVLKYDDVTGEDCTGNLLQRNRLSSMPLVWARNGDSNNLRTTSWMNQQWLHLSISDSETYSGLDFKSAAINPYNAFYFEADIASDNPTNLNIYAMGLDSNGIQIGADSNATLAKTITINHAVVNHIACGFKLPPALRTATYVDVRIQQPDQKPLDLKVANVKLAYDAPVANATNLIPMGNLSHSVLAQANALGDNSVISTDYLNGEEWIKLNSNTSETWQGISWDMDSNYDPSREMELNLDLSSNCARDLQIYAVPYGDKGELLTSGVQTLKSIQLPGDYVTYHIDQRFKLNDSFKNTNLVNIRIQQPGQDVLELYVKNVHLGYASEDNNESRKNGIDYNLPTVKITGDLSGMTKDNAKKVTYEYTNGSTVLNGYAKLKWQGNSTTLWDKKGYRLQPFTDSTFSKKQKVQFIPQWSPTSKINLKAYYTDGLLSRDVVNANIGADVVSTNFSLPDDLKKEDNFGFIDGFPIALIFNGEFEGIYSFNTARSDFDYVKYGIMGNGYSNVTNFTSADKADVKLDGSDFESLNPETVTDDEKSAVGDLVTWVATSTDENFKADFEKHLDLKTTIDYFILGNLLDSVDSFGKNQIFLTWDGQKWFMQMYDLDTTFGISWEGKAQDLPTKLIGTQNNLFKRLAQLFNSEISARYAELRTWLTPAYVLDKYKKRTNEIGVANYQKEFDKWNDPSKDIATYNQLKNAVIHQFKLLDQLWLKK